MNWFRRSLTSKFIALLLGFLALQVVQLSIGIFSVLHLGEEGAKINEAGRQRMRTVLLANLADEALDAGAWEGEKRALFDATVAEYDAYFAHISEFLSEWKYRERMHDPMNGAQKTWELELKPFLAGVGPSGLPGRAALARYNALVPAQIERLDDFVKLLEQHLRTDSRKLAAFQAIVLFLTLLLGVVGLIMARHVVTRPMRRLIEATHAIAEGAYDKRIAVSSADEIGELGRTFNRMVEAVAANTATLADLNRVTREISSTLDLDELLDRIMLNGLVLSGAQAAAVAYHDQKTGRFTNEVTQDLSEHFISRMSFLGGGLAEEAFEMGGYIQCNDRPGSKHRLTEIARKEGFTAFICLPLMSRTRRLGIAYFYRRDRDVFLPGEIELLSTLANIASEAIDNARLHAEAVNLATTDALTELPNRRVFSHRLEEEIQRAHRYGKVCSLLMLDIDHFKEINDTYGHQNGDVVLQMFARTIEKQVRDVDVVARYGGEEFVAILPETDDIGARLAAERIRRSISSSPLRLPGGREVNLTVSIGIACYPVCGENTETLVAHADQALYTAKGDGRNRTCLYRELLKFELERRPQRIVELLNQSLENIPAIVMAVSTKALFFRNHSDIVQLATKHLGAALGLTKTDMETLRLAALLHDVGMICIPDAILNKRAALTAEEREMIETHPAVSAGFLEQVPALRHIAPIVRHHHERYDGGGYPDGVTGADTPYLARVLAVTDAYAAMITEWPGQRAKSMEEVKAELTAGAGSRFDPKIAGVFIKLLDEEDGDMSVKEARRA